MNDKGPARGLLFGRCLAGILYVVVKAAAGGPGKHNI